MFKICLSIDDKCKFRMIIRLRSNLIWSNVFEIVSWFYWRQQIYFVVGTSFKCVFIKNVRNIKPRNKTESAMFKGIIQTCKHWLCSTLRQPGQEKQHPHYLRDHMPTMDGAIYNKIWRLLAFVLYFTFRASKKAMKCNVAFISSST